MASGSHGHHDQSVGCGSCKTFGAVEKLQHGGEVRLFSATKRTGVDDASRLLYPKLSK